MYNFSNKKVLILGAKGNLGTQLARVFGNKYRLFLFDKHNLDCLDYKVLNFKIKEIEPDIIINAVAYNVVDKCEESNEDFVMAKKLNGELLEVLSELCLKIDALLVHYSSDYVFGKIGKNFYNENDEYCPVNRYGETKVLGEKNILSKSKDGLKYYIIRTSKLFGPQGESEICKPSFFDIMLNLAKEKDVLNVVDDELSCFTYTGDLAKITLDLVDEKKEFGIYHVVNEGVCTWYEAVLELFKIKKIKIKVNPVSADFFSRAAKRPESSVLKNTKLKKLENYKLRLTEYLKNN